MSVDSDDLSLMRDETFGPILPIAVVVTADETGAKKLGFVYPEGPAQPRLERDLIVAAGARRSRKRVEPALKHFPRERLILTS